MLIENGNSTTKNYSKSTIVPEVLNKTKFTTSKADHTIETRKGDNNAKQTEVNPTVTTSQPTSSRIERNNTVSKDQTSEVVTTSTISNTLVVTTKNRKVLNGLGSKTDLDKNKTNTPVKSTTKDVIPTQTPRTVENADKNRETNTDTSTSENELGTPREKYSRNFIYMVVALLVFCLCCCYFFVWRYSKLPLFPHKNHPSFTKGVLTEKPPIESSYEEIKV